MAKITKILHTENRGDKALVNVQLNDGTEAVVIVAGEVEVFLHKGIICAFVKRGAPKP